MAVADLEVAVEDCRQALALDSRNSKAAYRKQCLEAHRRQLGVLDSGAEQVYFSTQQKLRNLMNEPFAILPL